MSSLTPLRFPEDDVPVLPEAEEEPVEGLGVSAVVLVNSDIGTFGMSGTTDIPSDSVVSSGYVAVVVASSGSDAEKAVREVFSGVVTVIDSVASVVSDSYTTVGDGGAVTTAGRESSHSALLAVQEDKISANKAADNIGDAILLPLFIVKNALPFFMIVPALRRILVFPIPHLIHR